MCYPGISQALEYFYVTSMDDLDARGRFDLQNLWKLFKTSYIILRECSHVWYYKRPNLDSSAGTVNPCRRYRKFLIGQRSPWVLTGTWAVVAFTCGTETVCGTETGCAAWWTTSWWTSGITDFCTLVSTSDCWWVLV